jgi:hypothetical protein
VRLLAALALVATLAPGAYAAEPDGDADLRPDGEVRVEINATEPGLPGSRGRAIGPRPLIRYRITYEVHGNGPARSGDLSGLCLVSGDATDPVLGFQYWIVGTDPEGKVVVDRLVCVPFDTEHPGTPPLPPTPPQPPTVADAWNAAHLRTPNIRTDPATRGITGLETRIWAEGPTQLRIAASAHGYTITGTATLHHYAIGIDGAPPTATTRHYVVFETKGMHRITVAAVWRGEAMITGPGITEPIHLDDIGTATLRVTRTYVVNEVRSVLES